MSYNLFCVLLQILGLQQAPAIGRAVMEIISENGYNTIDLRKFGFGRLIAEQPLYERCIV